MSSVSSGNENYQPMFQISDPVRCLCCGRCCFLLLYIDILKFPHNLPVNI